MEVEVVESEAIGSSWAKANKLSPDGLMQMTLQLAHYRLHGKAVSAYESASTAAFKHGRTETIRAATPESLKMYTHTHTHTTHTHIHHTHTHTHAHPPLPHTHHTHITHTHSTRTHTHTQHTHSLTHTHTHARTHT
ncbi:Choline/Carnitine o-acyltransferase-domain-containing protein [Pavlovales sp. CCMP2436]|nr:Choline/Carnitine o-acyltransferase-domain-containing protein [Pavlovales sp. CCMP2436]